MIHKSRMGKRMMAMLLCGTLTFTSVVPAMASELPETETAVQSAVTEEESAAETGSPEETSAVAESQDGGVKQDIDAVDQPTDETKEKTGVTDETTDAGSDTSNAIPEGQDSQEEAQQSDVAELALDGEGDAVPLENDGTITADEALTEDSLVNVKLSTTEEKFYYSFRPETTGDYYFQYASDKDINGYCENLSNEIEIANGLMHLDEGKTYYFCFFSCDDEYTEEESEVMLAKKIALDVKNTKIQIDGTSCELAEGQYFNLPKVKYTLSYTNDECKQGEIAACVERIEGMYDEQYVFALEAVSDKDKDLYFLNNAETGLSKGTYKVWLYDEISKQKIVAADNYSIEVKGFADFKANELSAGTDISVNMSSSYKNEYTYYTFTAEKDAYYLQLNGFDSSSYINVYYYDEEGKCRQLKLRGNLLKTQKDTTYYVTFNVYSEEEENEIDTVTADFGIKKNIDSYKIIEGKTDYLSLIDTPLSDWALLITYKDETMPVEYHLNHLNTYWDWDSETEAETAPSYNQDNYGNTLYCTFTKLRGSIAEKYETGETGKYTLKVGTDEIDLKEYTVNITKPTPTDWKNNGRVLTVGDNTINTMADDDIYFFFRPERTGEYILSDPEWTMDRDSILIYNGGSLDWADYEFADDGSIILPAKANTEYYLNAALRDETGTRTITIKEKNTHKHSYTSAVTKAPTCTTAGIRTYTCTASDDSYTESIPAAGHKLTTLPAKAATCTATGLTEGKQCTVCGTITVPQQTTPALGHAMGGWVTTQTPTALADGAQTRTCSRCGYAETVANARLAATGFLNATNVPLKVKQSATLTVRDMAAGDYVASWNTSNAKVVTVNNGKLTGKKKGTATVTATLASGRVLTATVKVQTGNVKTTGIAVNTRQIALVQGDVFQLVSSITPFTSKDKLSYKTSNKKVATVSKNGKITAKKAGKATITVKAGKKSVKVTVYVAGVKTTDLSVNTTQLNLKVKKKATIKAYVTPKNTSEKVTYKTSNKKVATVDKKGKVTAKKAGSATITVTSGSKSVKVNVIVTK